MKKQCPDCNIAMIELRKALQEDGSISEDYPKLITEPNLKRNYNEYRFFCKRCKKEWVYNSRPDCRCFEEVPSYSQLKYSPKRRLLISNKLR